MARKGYPGITLRGEDAKKLDYIAAREDCNSRAETVRRLVNLYHRVYPEAKAEFETRRTKEPQGLQESASNGL